MLVEKCMKKEGDRLLISEENGRYYIDNAEQFRAFFPKELLHIHHYVVKGKTMEVRRILYSARDIDSLLL